MALELVEGGAISEERKVEDYLIAAYGERRRIFQDDFNVWPNKQYLVERASRLNRTIERLQRRYYLLTGEYFERDLGLE